ncbi:hypothetical protein EAW55_03010 [Legionella jordanis]|nr:hypothetical protein EAW55_03010 [Legionella jordanis]RMX14990.1 hypothetical protein EAS68_13110 [Legionella jordanis]HAT8715103.1 hypothetical protein [Legionella jordanis]
MKTSHAVVLFFLSIGFNLQAFAAIKNSMNSVTPSQLQVLANNCPKDCTSCWDQCTKDDDCGSGHKCISTACGNRCVKETAD